MSKPDLLIVDSYDQARRALAALLRDCGYSVREASHRGGLQGARDRSPDLVIMEPWPSFSASLRMVERLHGASATARVPVLAVTSAATPEYRARALAAGCAGYLEKPCPPAVVLAEVRRLLSPSTPLAGGAAAVRREPPPPA